MSDINLFSIASKRRKSGQKIASLKNAFDVTDLFIKEKKFFAHGWNGCNTASSTDGHGKPTILKYLKENKQVREISQIFKNWSASQLKLLETGIRLFLLMFGAKQTTLNIHRYITHTRVNSSFSRTQPKTVKFTFNKISC